jgi:hypothetical protein
MDITRNVILDLLPLYLADEVSADTRALVDKYLESDPQLANLAKQSAEMEFPGDIPVPLTEEDKMKAYRKTRWIMVLTVVILAALMAFALWVTMYAFFVSA